MQGGFAASHSALVTECLHRQASPPIGERPSALGERVTLARRNACHEANLASNGRFEAVPLATRLISPCGRVGSGLVHAKDGSQALHVGSGQKKRISVAHKRYTNSTLLV